MNDCLRGTWISSLPEDVQQLIYRDAHQALFAPTLRSVTTFDRGTLLDTCGVTRGHTGYHWVDLHQSIIDVEHKLQSLIATGQYIFQSYTNIPAVIQRKLLGDDYERLLCHSVVDTGRLPDQLRRYLLYNPTPRAKFYHICFGLKAGRQRAEVRVFPGGMESWAWLHESAPEAAELMDLSRHQWQYLDFDLDINKLLLVESVAAKLQRVTEMNKTRI